MALVHNQTTESILGISSHFGYEKCESYLLFCGETALGDVLQAFLYFLGLAYCFLGLSVITARFFWSMENVVKQTRNGNVSTSMRRLQDIANARGASSVRCSCCHTVTAATGFKDMYHLTH